MIKTRIRIIRDLYGSEIMLTHEVLQEKHQLNFSFRKNLYPNFAFTSEQAESSCPDLITIWLFITDLYNMSFDSTGITQNYYFKAN